MPFSYPIVCTNRPCPNPAQFKIAARWTDGITEELKTYGLTCEQCLADVYRRSMEKQKSCHLAQGEVLSLPRIFHLRRGQRDGELQPLPELEEIILQAK